MLKAAYQEAVKRGLFDPRLYLRDLHPKQAAFVLDPSRRRAALCSRRAGKSYGGAALLLSRGQDDPGGLSVYIGDSKGLGRLILGEALDYLNLKYCLGLKTGERDGQLVYRMPNGHALWIAGCKDRSEVGKFRGPKYQTCIVDEAQEKPSFLDDLVDNALAPALLDKRGHLVLSGTPGIVPSGLFYEATTGRWPTHSWTIEDNPYIPNAVEEIRAELARAGLDETSPTYRREWLGQWVTDISRLVYPFDPDKNVFWELPKEGLRWGLGIDLGYEDSTAFVLAAYRPREPEVWIARAEKRQGLIPSAVAAHVERYRREFPGLRIVVDEGGFGKGYAEEMRQTYGIHCEPAEKSKKRAHQELLAGQLMSGAIKIHPYECRVLVSEMQALTWGADQKSEDKLAENHACDAMLYIARALFPQYRPEVEPPVPGSAEAMAVAEAKLRRETFERVRKEQKQGQKWQHPR